MAKQKDPVTEQIEKGVEAGASMASVLSDLVSAVETPEGAFSEDAFIGSAQVAASPVNLLTPDKLQNIIQGAAVQQQGLKQYDAKTYAAFEQALRHVETNQTQPSVLASGNSAQVIPATVRDIPQRLYEGKHPTTGRPFYTRAKADKIQAAVFGDANPRIKELAARSGFDQKPLVFISQIVWLHVNDDLPHKFREFQPENPEHQFTAAIDQDDSSPVLQALHTFLEHTTVRRMTVLARHEEVSVLAVIRCIMADVCTQRGIPQDWGQT